MASPALSDPLPSITSGVPANSFLGEQFCFDTTLTNENEPGFGPYLRLVLPADLSFNSASIFGSGATVTNVGTFPASGNLTDPLTGQTVTGSVGSSFRVIEMPIGSVVEDGPDLTMTICLSINPSAVIGDALPVDLTPVYRYGDTATGDNGPIVGATPAQTVTPTVLIFSKSNNTPESERPPGSPWPYTYTLTVDIANTATINPIIIQDILPSDFQYQAGSLSIIPSGGGITWTTLQNPSTGTLEIECTSDITGTTSASDIVVTYSGYIEDILDETDCGTDTLDNIATVDAFYVPSSGPVVDVSPSGSETSTVTAKHLALQKSVAPGTVEPGDTITYTLNGQITDFTSTTNVNALEIEDTLADGLRFDAGSATLTAPGYASVGIVPSTSIAGDGSQVLIFDVDDITGSLANGTAFSLSYTATVQTTYSSSGTPVLAADPLPSTVTATYSLDTGASGCTEDSQTNAPTVSSVILSKQILNPDPTGYYNPGDVVTYELTMEIPSGDANNVRFEDYLPLPVFDVSLIDISNFGATYDIRHGTSDTTGITPTITIDAAQNAIFFDWVNITAASAQILQLEMDVTIVDEPFADDLALTNLLLGSTENTNGDSAVGTAPDPIKVRAPELVITKGVAATTHGTISPLPGILPVDGNLTGADGGDEVTFQITLENIGGAPAYDLVVTDNPPAQFDPLSLSLDSVTDGTGTAIAYGGNLFTTGLTITGPIAANDDNPAGGGQPFTDDTVIIQYTCTLTDAVTPRLSFDNEATATWTADAGAAISFPEITDIATVTIAAPTISKSVSSVAPGPWYSSPPPNNAVVPGDVVTYQLSISVPQGTTPDLIITDTLPAGFDYIDPSVNVNNAGFTGTLTTSPSVSFTDPSLPLPHTLTIDFNDVVATGDSVNGNDSFIVTFQARVMDDSLNTGNPLQTKTNTVSLDFDTNPGGPLPASSAVRFGEPDLVIDSKIINPSSNLQAGQTVTITINLRNNGTAPAFDITVEDELLTTIFVPGSIASIITPGGFSYSGVLSGNIVTWTGAGPFNPGATAQFQFDVNIASTILTGSTYSNTANVTGDSQSGTVNQERTTDGSGSDSFTTLRVSGAKSIIASSESWTNTESTFLPATLVAAIGEIITYEFYYNIPNGVTRDGSGGVAVIRDILPAGLQYIGGTAQIRAQAADGTTLNGSGFGDIATTYAGNSITPSTPGQEVRFNLGNITNRDTDPATQERIYIKLNALVLNTAINDNLDDSDKTNRARLRDLPNGAADGRNTDRTINFRVEEPNPTLTKEIVSPSPPTVQGGDTVDFRITFTNTAGTRVTRGWEPVITDTLPAQYLSPTVPVVTISSGPRAGTGLSGSFSGNELTADMSNLAANEQYLDPDEAIQVEFSATVDPNIGFGETVPNTSRGEMTSLPGTNGTTTDPPNNTGSNNTGAPGDSDGERTGDSTHADPPNDLFSTEGASVTADIPTLLATEKVVDTGISPPPYAIGDIVRYTITVTVPAGTGDMEVRDDLPDSGGNQRMIFNSATTPFLTFTGGVTADPVNPLTVTDNSPNSPEIIFNINNIDAPPGGGTITIHYDAQVANVSDNQAGDSLENTATAYFGVTLVGSATESITVSEPEATMTKSVISEPTPAIPGSIVRWRFTVENTGDTTAWQTDISDPLPAGLNQISDGTVVETGGVLNSASATVSVADAVISGPGNNTISFSDLTFPVSASLTVEFDSVIMTTITPGRLLNNIVTATFASQPTGTSSDPNSEVRDGADGPGGLNDYEASTNQTFGFRLERRAMRFENPTCTACDPVCPIGTGFFVSVDDDGDAVADTELDLTTAGTIEAWIQATSCTASDADAGIVMKGTSTASYGFGLSGGTFFDDGSGSADAQNIGFRLGSDILVATDHTILPGKWYHVACVWDATQMRIYINGILEETRNGATSVPVTTEDLILGQQTISTGAPLQYYGNIDEFRLWSIARTEAEIRDNMCRSLALNPPATFPVPGLACYLQADEDDGDIQDISGNGNNGVFNDADRTCSAAPIGDTSAHDYVGGGGTFTKTIANLAATESITVTEDGGTWGSGPVDKSGLQVYRTEIPPEPAHGPIAWKTLTERGYYGVFVTGGTDPTYTVTYDYDPAGIGDETTLDLLTRNENCMPWRPSNATPDPVNDRIEKTLQSGTEYILGVPMDPRNAILFDGTDDYVSVADAGALRLTTDGTMEVWVYITNYQTDAGIIGKGDTTDGYALYTDSTTGDQIEFSLYNSGASTTVSSNVTLNRNTWYHIAATWDDADVMHLYINGVLDNSSAAAASSGDTTNDNLTIGRWNGNYFEGLIDEVRVWDTARDRGEIRSTMCRKITSTEPAIANLVGYWRFDEETDSATCGDSSGNNRAGTMNTTTPAPGFSDIRDARRCSSAPIGDDSAHAYYGTGGSPVSQQLAHPDGDYLFAAENSSGTWDDTYSGLHIYRVDAPPVYPPHLWLTPDPPYGYKTPNGMTPPTNWSSIDYYRYWGVFVTDWDAANTPSYDADYYYQFNPSVPSGANGSPVPSPQIGLAERQDYCFGTWSNGAAVWDSANLRLRLSGKYQFGTPPTTLPTNPEYILGGINQPLAITLSSFTAKAVDGCVEIRWETATEIDTAGFYLWRSNTREDGYICLFDSFTESKSTSGTTGATYFFKDCGVNLTNGEKYYYILEELEIDTTGEGMMHGPIGPVTETITAIKNTVKGSGGDNSCFIDVLKR